jgi:hypothetical protein
MNTYTTKACADLLYSDDFRSNGCPDVFCIENVSRTVEVQATNDEIQEFQIERCIEVDSDLMADHVLNELIDFLLNKDYIAFKVKR